MSDYRWFRQSGLVLVAIAAITTLGFLQVPQLNQLKQRSTAPSLDQVQHDTEAQKVQLDLLEKVPTLGFNNMVANWAFLNFLQYFGDETARQKSDYSLSPDFFDVIVNQDPYFLQPYFFLSTSTAIYAGMPTRSVALMDEGLKSLTPTIPPYSYFIWRNKGVDELLFLGNAQAAQRSFAMTVEWAMQSQLPGSDLTANLSQQMVQFLATNPDSKVAQVAAWAMVLNSAPDDRTRRIAGDRIQQLGGQVTKQRDGTFKVIPPPKD